MLKSKGLTASTRLVPSLNKNGGFTMVELLISVLLVTTGLVNIMLWQFGIIKNSNSAYLRTQASFLASEMANKIRTNANGASNYHNIDSNSITTLTEPSCITAANGCTPSQTAQADLSQWLLNFKDVSGRNIANYQPVLPNGRAQISKDGDQFTITISWLEDQWSNNNSTALTSGNSQITMEFTL